MLCHTVAKEGSFLLHVHVCVHNEGKVHVHVHNEGKVHVHVHVHNGKKVHVHNEGKVHLHK